MLINASINEILALINKQELYKSYFKKNTSLMHPTKYRKKIKNVDDGKSFYTVSEHCITVMRMRMRA